MAKSLQGALIQVAGGAGLVVLVLFLVWEGIERTLAPDDATTHHIHYARGISTSLLTAMTVAAIALRQHRRQARALREEVAARTRELEEARRLLELVVDTTPAALLVLDRDYNVVKVNRVAEQVHGAPLVGRRCFDSLSGRAERCTHCPAATTFETGAPQSIAAPKTDPRTGEVLCHETHPLRLPDGREYVLLVERVVTEQSKLQARLLHHEKMAAFGLLAAGVAHEMGNPLASIEAQFQLLDPAAFSGEDAEAIHTVRVELARLRRILRELQDFARRRRDEATLVCVQSVVCDALRLLRHDPRMRSVRTREEFDPETPPVFMVEDHLMQVVLNLLLNALDAMPGGGTLRSEVRPAGAHVALRVHDTGIGMDRATLGHCFEPLFTTKAPGKGTGLGLSLSRDILHAVSGEIELHSAPGKGTTAVVTLPAAALDAARPGLEGHVA